MAENDKTTETRGGLPAADTAGASRRSIALAECRLPKLAAAAQCGELDVPFVTANAPPDLRARYAAVASHDECGVSEAVTRWLVSASGKPAAGPDC